MVGGLSKVIYLPAMLTQQLGYFDKAGVNVNLIDEPAGGEATENMLAGQVQGVVGFYDHTIALQAKGKASESVVSMLQIPGEVEMCRTRLKGKITSPPTSRAGSSASPTPARRPTSSPSTSRPRTASTPSTTSPQRRRRRPDVHRGDEAEGDRRRHDDRADRRAGPQDGTGSCSTCAPRPAPRRRSADLPVHVAVHDDRLGQRHKDTVQKLANAFVKTLKWIQAHTAPQIADKMPADYYAGRRQGRLRRALDSEKGIFNPTGVMPPTARRPAWSSRRVQPERQGQDDRPDQDLHRRVRQRRHSGQLTRTAEAVATSRRAGRPEPRAGPSGAGRSPVSGPVATAPARPSRRDPQGPAADTRRRIG